MTNRNCVCARCRQFLDEKIQKYKFGQFIYCKTCFEKVKNGG